MNKNVKAWEEKVIIPTYEIGEAEKNPIFLEKRVYQGSSGSVYPHPVVEKISNTKTNKEWNAVFIENQYIKIMLLPELGGRVQLAYDKIKQRHFVYYNSVIKPALVGLTGPWISGGIEFNWPQHHRPSTYLPTEHIIEENSDDSITVWCSEVERMFRTKGMAGFTLHHDKAYLEIKVKLYNRTNHPQTFLWWANPAVVVHDDYQSVFPPDVNAVFDHGKRDVSKFPIATGEYYKHDYSAGVDISKYKNIPVPTSYMAITSKYNFVGGYENNAQGGLLHVANHHISPGKKQWTWGNGDFGQAWDRNLTDSDGPYIELMCGVYTDNQPDFSWLMPYEEKSFSQYFMPYRDLGVVKNASKDVMLNLTKQNEEIKLQIYTTSVFEGINIKVTEKGEEIFNKTFDSSPEMSIDELLSGNFDFNKLYVQVKNSAGRLLIDWKPENDEIKEVPEAAKPAKEPSEIKSIEELYITGLHLEQYRHATYIATDYYTEALKREPGDVRCNNAMGLWYLRKGVFNKAQAYFHKAISTLTEKNPNPYNGEPYFNLGQCLKYQGKYNKAYDAFYKSVWNDAWQAGGYFNIAQIDMINGDFDLALEHIEKSLIKNWHNHKARHLKAAILRKLNKHDESLKFCDDSLEIDKFNYGVLFEKYLISKDEKSLSQLKHLINNNIHNYIEYSIDYASAGMYEEAIELLETGIKECSNDYAMSWYYLGWFSYQKGDITKANEYFLSGDKCSPDYCFPNRTEAVNALEVAISTCSNNAKANYYLGNFWYANRQYDNARNCWEASIKSDSTYPTVYRNLALAYYNKFHKKEEVVKHLEKAFELDKTDARVLMELDQLYKKINITNNKRLDILNNHPQLTDFRDDLYLEKITLLNNLGEYQTAYDMIMNRTFHPWEGGEGKVTGQYLFSLTNLALDHIKKNDFENAIVCLEKCKSYPDNLGEGKLTGAQENDIDFWLGVAYTELNDTNKAKFHWELASEGNYEPSAAFFYNDQHPDKIFYQGMALLKLNKVEQAYSKFNKLIDFGEKHIFDKVKIDYFAVSLPDLLIWDESLDLRNQINCWYLMALGHLGMNNNKESDKYFKMVMENDKSHQGAIFHSHRLPLGLTHTEKIINF